MDLVGNNPNSLTAPAFPIQVPNIIGGIESGNLCCLPNIDTVFEKFMPTMNQTLYSMILVALATQKYRPDTKTSFHDEYDYIVVGAGSAGAALAARLSEKECVKVLLLEAGSSPPILSEIPGIARLFLLTDINWNYLTEPQKNTGYGLYQNKLPFPGGKGVGGSSLVNAMLYIRGNHRDYDEWGVDGWQWNDVFPYFKKLEDNVDPEYANNGYHGTGGPVTMSRTSYMPELKARLLEYIKENGFPFVDPNGATQIGFSDYQSNIRKGQRCSSAKAYLAPNDKRPNLDIVANAFAKRIVIEANGNSKKATGVIFDFNRKEHFVKARREIILSAGTVNSAQLLMLSGVGPKDTLNKLKIPVMADLDVGKNLQDHICTINNFVVHAPMRQYPIKLFSPDSLLQYAIDRTGPLTSNEGVFTMAFMHRNDTSTPTDYPNFQLYFMEGTPLLAKLSFGIKPLVYKRIYGPYELSPQMWCLSSILHPKSIGYVSIRSTNPYDPPIIDPKFLENEEDVRDIVAGMKECLKVAESPQMVKLGVRPFRTLVPGCEHLPKDGDEYFACQARQIVFTLSHQVGTVKMGDPNDPTTVVDPQLRVKGIESLRVADASIMPKAISGNTNIPSMMVGEKAADIIKETIEEC